MSFSNSLSLSLFTVALFVSLLLSHLNIVASDGDEGCPSIQVMCGKASHPALCVALGPQKNMYDLELASIGLGKKMASKGVSDAEKALSGSPDDKHKENLEKCKDIYNQAIDYMSKAEEVVKAKGPDTELNWLLSMALTQVDSCSTLWHKAGITEDFALGPTSEHLIRQIRNTLSLGNNMGSDDKKDKKASS